LKRLDFCDRNFKMVDFVDETFLVKIRSVFHSTK
jgi:hypothetical protein